MTSMIRSTAPRFLLSLAVLVVLAVTSATTAFASDKVPSFRKLGVDPVALADMIGDSQLVLIREPVNFSYVRGKKSTEKEATFITSMKVVNAPVSKVRQVVSDTAKYPDFIAEVKKTKAMTRQGIDITEFSTVLNMLVLSVGVDYTLAYRTLNNGDIIWQMLKGDVGEHTGRFEFFELPDNRTLLVMTQWQDLEAIGLSVRMVLGAQPDLKLVLPVTWSAVITNSLYRRAEGLPAEETAPAEAKLAEPETPMMATGRNPVSIPDLRRLAEAGTLLFVHPKQWFKVQDGKAADFQFLSAASVIDVPVERMRDLTTSFERFPEFLDQVSSIKQIESVDGRKRYRFQLKIGISVFSIGVSYVLEYDEMTPLAIAYKRVEGDMEQIYGAWEFFDVGDGKSLVLYTTGNRMGNNAPAVLRVGSDAPNRDLIVGTSSTALTIQKLIPWVQAQQKAAGKK